MRHESQGRSRDSYNDGGRKSQHDDNYGGQESSRGYSANNNWEHQGRDASGQFTSESRGRGYGRNDSRRSQPRDEQGRFADDGGQSGGGQYYGNESSYDRDDGMTRGAGYGQGNSRAGENTGGGHSQHDADYLHWRNEQMGKLDEDYQGWQSERRKKFSEDFDKWRSDKSGKATTQDAADKSK